MDKPSSASTRISSRACDMTLSLTWSPFSSTVAHLQGYPVQLALPAQEGLSVLVPRRYLRKPSSKGFPSGVGSPEYLFWLVKVRAFSRRMVGTASHLMRSRRKFSSIRQQSQDRHRQ